MSPHGDATIEPNLITASAIVSAYDIVFLSVKSYGLASAMNDFAPAVGTRTVILPVLNGMRQMDALEQRFGIETLLGGVCLGATELTADGRIIQLADFQSLRYGELDGQKTERVEAVDLAFRGAGFNAAIFTQIIQDMWQKWVQLASLGAITCLLRGNIGEIVAVPVAPICLMPPCANVLQSQHCAGIRHRARSSKKRKPRSPRLAPR